MVAKSLVKLIDEAVIPALVLILAKMLGLFLVIFFLDLPFKLQSRNLLGILPSLHFDNLQDYIRAENYSNLVMFLASAAGTSAVLARAHLFHESHIHPKLHARLVSLNLESLVSSTYHLYHQAAIWLTFLWLTVGFLAASTILGVTYPQISIIAFVVAANFSWVLALDVEKEIELERT